MQSLKKYLLLFVVILLIALGMYGYFVFGNQMRASRAVTKGSEYASKMYGDYNIVGQSCQGEDTNNDGYITCNFRLNNKDGNFNLEKTITLQCPTYIKSWLATSCKEQGIVINQQ